MTFIWDSLRTISVPINISLTPSFTVASDRAARLRAVNVQLIKDIHAVKCPGAEQTENLVDKSTKNTHYKSALVHDDRRNMGDDCEGKDWGWFSCAALPNIWCQETGIMSVPSWISMRQKGGDVVDAAWQNPPLSGGRRVLAAKQ